MPFNTFTVSAAVTPSVIETYFSHYLKRAPLRQKPTAHISYHEGLRLIREFLEYSSKHTVEDLQNFTAQWVPCPTWVRINDAEIAPKFLDRAARSVQAQLGHRGLEMIGGKTWWQWRRPDSPLRAEWIEMKKEYLERKRTGAKCERVILYVHGGAYYFGSVDEHRYQMQRHARKLKARVLSPRYRLAPQFPFPCGLYDCIATYYYLLEHFKPSEILFAGDSAGAGMVVSMLVILRDQGEPLPAGTILLSPWVDLTHSFPSVNGDGSADYIPAKGFHHKPSMAWPPSPSEGCDGGMINGHMPGDAVELPGDDEQDMLSALASTPTPSSPSLPPPRFGEGLFVDINGKRTELKDQIHLYTPNNLLSHPLVSPILQPSLGGLPPMLIQTGGGELLKDEQIYLAHKAANPAAYAPNATIMREFDPDTKILQKWPPTDVQLQVWDDLCHVAHTLSFTRPAKYMYRGVAQFGAWALSRANDTAVDIPANDDALSIISSGAEDGGDDEKSLADSSTNSQLSAAKVAMKDKLKKSTTNAVGKAGDPLPLFVDHMIRQRVTRHGIIHPLDSISELACLSLDPSYIGVPKVGPVKKWLAARQSWDTRFASDIKKVSKKRAKEASLGYDSIPGEHPPSTALVNRRRRGVVNEEKKKGRGWGLAMWSGWGSSHDEQTLQREDKVGKDAGRKDSANGVPTRERSGSAAGLYTNTDEHGGERVRRRSSVAARMQRPWLSTSALAATRERQGSVPEPANNGARDDVVIDEGQADERSTALPSRSDIWLSGHGNQMMGTTRPMSASVNSPIPIEDEIRHRRQESQNARDAPIAISPVVEPMSQQAKEKKETSPGSVNGSPPNGAQTSSAQVIGTEATDTSTSRIEHHLPVVQEIGPPSTPRMELMGDEPGPVELPSTPHIRQHEPEERENEAQNHYGETPQLSMTSAASTSEPRSSGALEPPTPIDKDDIVSPITPAPGPNGGDDVIVSPVEQPAQQKFPFKLRNQVFDHRTSMLGSLGADGMPNAHYAFLRDDSPRRAARSETSTPEPGNRDENKPPFKLRHAVYDQDSTPSTSKRSSYLHVPEGESSSATNHHRESGALGLQLGDQRIVGDQRDRPPSYENVPLTNVTMPEPVAAKRTIVKDPLSGDDGEVFDMPPPPPPKDEKHVKSKGKITGLRKPVHKVDSTEDITMNGVENAPVPAATSVAPVIGDLSFERL